MGTEYLLRLRCLIGRRIGREELLISSEHHMDQSTLKIGIAQKIDKIRITVFVCFIDVLKSFEGFVEPWTREVHVHRANHFSSKPDSNTSLS